MLFKVLCPRCGKRLFDIRESSEGTVHIKCTRCKTFSVLDLFAAQRDQQSQATEPTSTPSERK